MSSGAGRPQSAVAAGGSSQDGSARWPQRCRPGAGFGPRSGPRSVVALGPPAARYLRPRVGAWPDLAQAAGKRDHLAHRFTAAYAAIRFGPRSRWFRFSGTNSISGSAGNYATAGEHQLERKTGSAALFRVQFDESHEPAPSSPEINAVAFWPLDQSPGPISDFTERRIRDALLDAPVAIVRLGQLRPRKR